MTVMSKAPFWLKVLCPILFLIDWLRRYVHFSYIVHDCAIYHRKCSDLYQPFYQKIRQRIVDIIGHRNGRKRQIPVILEFGCGPFPALEAYPPGIHYIGVEPCPDFDQQFREAWSSSHLANNGKLTVYRGKLEEIDESVISSNSVDVVFSRMTNCSLSNMERSFKTIHRILKPGGRYYYWDHVLADNDEPLKKLVQYALSCPLVTFFSDCSLARQPWLAMKKVGFKHVHANRFKIASGSYLSWPFTSTANGYAEK